jgi:diguanylate cyclase (GGDEF)-like protein
MKVKGGRLQSGMTSGGVIQRNGSLRVIIFLALLGLVAIFGPASAQGHRFARLADTIFQSTTQDSELPNDLIMAIAQDADGFVWLGTQGGLKRWDGTHSRFYTAGAASGSLPDNVVTVLHCDPQGHLWIGTDTAGISRYDAGTDTFVRVRLNNAAAEAGVSAIIDDRKGGLWVGTGGGLFHVDRNGVATPAITSGREGEARSGSPRYQVLALLLDRAGMLWVGTRSGLAKANLAEHRFDQVSLPLGADAEPGTQAEISRLMLDSTGAIWVGTQKNGTFIVPPDNAPILAAPAPQDSSGATIPYGVYAIEEVVPGVIWIGTDGRGILEIQRRTGIMRNLRHDPWVKTSLISDSVRALFKDHSGKIWVGTERGANLYDPSQRAVATMFGVADRSTGLSDPDILSFLAMPDGKVWAGSRYHGIDIIDPLSGQVSLVWPNARHLNRSLPPFAINSMAAIEGGMVLAATDSGLYRVNGAGTSVERLSIPGRAITQGALSLCVCHGDVWLGGRDGLWRIAVGATGPVRVIAKLDGTKLTDPRVQVIYPGAGDTVWVGTANGITIVHAETGDSEEIFPNRADPTQLGSGEIASILIDPAGRLWIGTLDAGLYLLTGRDGPKLLFRHFGKAQGLPNEDINHLEFDAWGRIWMSTDAGLASLDPRDFSIEHYGTAEGVAIDEYWNGSGMKDADGDIMFGGLGGLTVVDPSLLLVRADQHPPLVVTDMRVGAKELWAGHPDAKGAIAPIVLHPEENSLHVEFTLLDFSPSTKASFEYRLEGFDPDWVQNAITPRLAAYTNLPPGQYVLRLRAVDRSRNWRSDTLALPVIVLPTWYQTPWFRLAVLIMGAVMVAALVQIRTALLRQRQRELERQVAERTAELSITQAQLRHFAYVDMLTGLPNRRAFTEEFRRLLDEAQLTRSRLALLLIDMDGFKQVNDTMGHHAGDALLVAVGGRLRGAVREGDFVARLGGDEFAVLLMLDDDAVELICQRIIDGFCPPISIEGQNLIAGASIGVAIFPDHGGTQERIYKMADVAMYSAKREGRGTWRCFASNMQAA